MNDIVYFASVCLLVLLTLYIILKILIKRFNPEKSEVSIYGILQGMKNKEIISLSCSIVRYIFLLYVMSSFANLDLYIVCISLFLTFISGFLIKDKLLIVNLLLNLVALGGIKLVYLIHDYIVNEYNSVWMLLLLVFLMIFLLLYLSYTLLGNIKSVVIKNKYVRKGGNNENKKCS